MKVPAHQRDRFRALAAREIRDANERLLALAARQRLIDEGLLPADEPATLVELPPGVRREDG